MKSRSSWWRRAVLALPLLVAGATAQALPEFPFCPLGGPTGWWNRLTDDDDRYYPPPYYPPPPVLLYWNQAYPYGNVPRYPLYPVPLIR